MVGEMERLFTHVDQVVQVEYCRNGQDYAKTGIFSFVSSPYVVFHINFPESKEGEGILFVGEGVAVRKISDANGNVLYENPLIPSGYNETDADKVRQLLAMSFGQHGLDALTAYEKEVREMRKSADEYWKGLKEIERGLQGRVPKPPKMPK
ncbi:hypothetical protein HY638_02225 [Candidatus Woesearchaeota archaeon]|nr:hypothetical protein [Candidatus Woesearchaeota archaeon]